MLDRSLTMLRRPKCMCCIPVETGCFIFAVFSAVLSGFGVVMLTVAQMWVTSVADQVAFDRTPYDLPHDSDTPDLEELLVYRRRAVDILATFAAVMFLYVCFLTSFIFSVFLCYGTHKKRSGFVKAYLVYGVVVTVLMMFGAILYSWMLQDIVGGSIVLIFCGIYSMLLLMVQRTHEVIRAEKARNQAQLLPEPEPCMKA